MAGVQLVSSLIYENSTEIPGGLNRPFPRTFPGNRTLSSTGINRVAPSGGHKESVPLFGILFSFLDPLFFEQDQDQDDANQDGGNDKNAAHQKTDKNCVHG